MTAPPRLPFPPNTPEAPGLRRGWQARSGPAKALDVLQVADYAACGYRTPLWADHAYRYRGPDGWVWVAEPYPECDGSFAWQAEFEADRAKLEAAGYRVRIDQTEARYLPGHTLPIVITQSAA
ncbi:hypothetical protein GCM10010302_26380 [Streptomyces polychromogenes]|uniref:Uncharacterized protein n=1 Tax=Streptomyces polychromogenes TaxID=67342 RepID=A0ABN0VC64_9ACTN